MNILRIIRLLFLSVLVSPACIVATGCMSSTQKQFGTEAALNEISYDDCMQIEISTSEQLRTQVSVQHWDMDTYLLTDGAWVEGSSLFVNQDFDFATAMTLEGVGAGIAAAKRQQASKKNAELFQLTKAYDINRAFCSAMSKQEHKINLPEGLWFSVYTILYGESKARLQTIVEIHAETSNQDTQTKPASDKSHPVRLVKVSKSLPIEGPNSWSTNQCKSYFEEVESSIDNLVDLLHRYTLIEKSGTATIHPSLEFTKKGSCNVGGNNVYKGAFIKKSTGKSLFRPEEFPATLMSCPDQT